MPDVEMLKNLDQSHNGSSIHKEVIRPVLNFLFYFFYDKISQALKSTETTINILVFFKIRFCEL